MISTMIRKITAIAFAVPKSLLVSPCIHDPRCSAGSKLVAELLTLCPLVFLADSDKLPDVDLGLVHPPRQLEIPPGQPCILGIERVRLGRIPQGALLSRIFSMKNRLVKSVRPCAGCPARRFDPSYASRERGGEPSRLRLSIV